MEVLPVGELEHERRDDNRQNQQDDQDTGCRQRQRHAQQEAQARPFELRTAQDRITDRRSTGFAVDARISGCGNDHGHDTLTRGSTSA
jgi:hypothetical protein